MRRQTHTLNPFVLFGRCLHAGGRFSRSEFAMVYLGSIAAFWGLAIGAGPVFLDAALASQGARHGYLGRFEAGEQPAIDAARSSPTSVLAYAYVARPVAAGQTGIRSFCGNSSGLVCYTPDGGDIATAAGACPRSADACTPLR